MTAISGHMRSGVCATFRLNISPLVTLTTYLCLAFPVADTSARLLVMKWNNPVSIWLRMGVLRSHTPVLQLGTHFLTVPKTLVFLYELSDVTL